MFEELGTAIDELDIPADGATLAAVVALRDRLDARISDAVAAQDHAGLWELDGATSMTAWLTDRAAMPRARAAATVARARKLTHLPRQRRRLARRGALQWPGRSDHRQPRRRHRGGVRPPRDGHGGDTRRVVGA